MSDVAVKKLLIGLAEFYGETLTPTRLKMFAEVLSDMPAVELERAIGVVTRDPRITRMPLPANLRQATRPSANPDHDALEASNRIVEAIDRFGWTNPKEAQAFIGELGWLVVQREGGWETICENTTARQLPTLKAQWRELAKAVAGRAQRGELETPPTLPSGPGGIVKSLAAKLSIARGDE